MPNSGEMHRLRSEYHAAICSRLLALRSGVPNNADGSSRASVDLAQRLVSAMGHALCTSAPSEQTAGAIFSELTLGFIKDAFALLSHLAPGKWVFSASQGGAGIAAFDQYEHLALLDKALARLPKKLAAALGGQYLVKPDIVIAREPATDREINLRAKVVSRRYRVADLTPYRRANKTKSTLHASVSCKWTIRSDRAQNTRTEALNLIRYRKGKTPHIVAVTGEPMPTRLASLALGTGDIDCVYHMALPELKNAVAASGREDQEDVLDTLVNGRRLRDIADLPFDLAT